MTSPPMAPKNTTFWIVLVGGLFALGFFVGLGWGLIWLGGFAAYGLAQLRTWFGVVFALAAAVVFILPPALDQTVLDQQVAAIEAQELSVPPIDMTGRTVLFLGGSRYAPWDCSDLCRALIEHGTAQAVFFGHDRSLDFRYGNGPIDLRDRVVHSFSAPIRQGLPSDTRSTPTALPQSVDYIVVEGPSLTPASLAVLVPDVPTYGGIYSTNSLWVEYLVFEGGDLSAFDPTTLDPIITRFDYNRYSHMFPGLPLFALGNIDYSHHHNPGLSQRVNANTREVGGMLCGPDQRPMYRACATVLD